MYIIRVSLQGRLIVDATFYKGPVAETEFQRLQTARERVDLTDVPYRLVDSAGHTLSFVPADVLAVILIDVEAELRASKVSELKLRTYAAQLAAEEAEGFDVATAESAPVQYQN